MTETNQSTTASSSRRSGGLLVCTLGGLALLMVAFNTPSAVVKPTRRSLRLGGASTAYSTATAPEESKSMAEEYLAEYKKHAQHASEYETVGDMDEVIEEELAEAEEIIEDLEEDEEKLTVEEIEEEAEEDGINDAKLKRDEELMEEDASPLGEELQELVVEEDKEKLVEEIVEDELGIDEFCYNCIWLGTSEYSCHDRVGFVKKVYKSDEDAVKLALMNDGGKCSNNDPERVIGIWEHGDRGKLLGIAGGGGNKML